MNMDRPFAFPAAILGGSLIVAALIAALAFYNVHTLDNSLTVTGSATRAATADSAKWTVSLARTAFEGGVSSAQSQVATDAQQVTVFFNKAGLSVENVTTSPVFVDPEYGSDTNAPRRFNVHQDVTVTSDKPDLILKLSKDIGALAARGIVVQAQAPQYMISNLPQLRVSLIGAAISDAKARALEIASSTGRGVGQLQSASGGVVQVLAPGSVDVADYGSYDTSTIRKTVMVTARATFYLR